MRRHAKAPSAGTTSGRVGACLSLLAVAILATCALLAPAAQAGKAPGFGVLGTGTGEGAGELSTSLQGVAANTTGAGGVTVGDVYVSDQSNQRISEFSGSGEFVRAFGIDVVRNGGQDNVPGANEVQEVAVKGTGGTFTLTFPRNGSTTTPIPYNAPASGAGSVQEGLEALSTIGAGNVEVSGGPGDETGSTPYVVTFVGELAGDDQPQMSSSAGGLTGTGKAATVSTTTEGGGTFEICEAESSPLDECKAGTRSAQAGGFDNPQGLAVDLTNGNIFVVDGSNRRIDVFSATGHFEGAFGWGVNATTPEEQLQFCTTVTGCLEGKDGEAAGKFEGLFGASPAVSPLNGHLFVPEPENRRVDEFSLTLNGSHEVTGASFLKAFGGDVAPTFDEEQEVALNGTTGGSFSLSLESHETGATGTGNLQAGSSEITQLETAPGVTFASGEVLSGEGIPAGTKITAATFDSLTLSAPVTLTKEGAAFSSALPFDASADALEGALAALPGVGKGNVTVGGADGGPWTIEFNGDLTGTGIAPLTGDASGLSGTTPVVEVTTIQDGSGGTSEGFETCTTATTCQKGGKENLSLFYGVLGAFPNQMPTSVAVDSSGSIYVTAGASQNRCRTGYCRVQKFNAAATEVESFASTWLQPSESVVVKEGSPNSVAIDPANDHVLVAKNNPGKTFKLLEFTKSGSLIDISPPGEAGFPGNNSGGPNSGGAPTAIAIGTEERDYAVINNVVRIFGNPPAPSATIEPAGEVTATSATFSGVAKPSEAGSEGGFLTGAYFEYSPDGISWKSTREVELGDGTGAGNPTSCPTGNPPSCKVTLKAYGLHPGTVYLVRLVATNGTKATSSTVSFETIPGGPTVSDMSPNPVGQTTATISGLVNPNSRPSTYHFEWGTDASYDTRIPAEYDVVAGSGTNPVRASAQLKGLQPGTTYHYRIVAANSAGTTYGEDATFTTLDSADLPASRNYELVSPTNKRPVGGVRRVTVIKQLRYQAAADGNEVAYPILNGLEDSEAGGEVIYAGARAASGWGSAEITPPSLIAPPNPGSSGSAYSRTGSVRYLDPKDLNCGVVETHNPLTADTPPADIANGTYNLYRWDRATGNYTLITNLVPSDPSAGGGGQNFELAGANADCSRVFFRSPKYSYLPGASPLYEWDEGTLRDAGILQTGAPGIPATQTGKNVEAEQIGLVSPDGRFFFNAINKVAPNTNKRGVFVRKSPTEVVYASEPQTATTTKGSTFEAASEDGSRVFFLDNYGIASESSEGPTTGSCGTITTPGTELCDLYSYDVDTEELTDISADANPEDTNGAVVQGLMAISEDGSTAYFAARGQLVPGEGSTYAENIAGTQHASVYRWHAGQISYVGSLSNADLEAAYEQGGPLIHKPLGWTAQTSKDGGYLLFNSRDEMDRPNPSQVTEAYLYSADSGQTHCISCPTQEGVLPRTEETRVLVVGARSLSEDGRVFFSSFEQLTPDAVEGHYATAEPKIAAVNNYENIYEWHDGQVSLLASGVVQLIGSGGPDGRDVFIRAYDQLNSEDTDFAPDLYDLRAGGGFAAKPPPPPPCDVSTGECQGPGSSAPAAQSPASAGFVGAGNQPVPPQAKPKAKHRKHKHKKRHKKRRRHAKRHANKHKRAAKHNRGGAK